MVGMLYKEIAYILRLSQSQLAKVLGITRQSLSQYILHSKLGCSAIHLFKLKEKYGDKIDLNKIFSEETIYNFYKEKNKKE